MAITRRGLLQIAGAGSVAGVDRLLGAFGDFFQPASPPAAAQEIITACGVCSPSCGMKATVENGTLRFLEGLPGDFSGRGKLCGKGAAGAGFLYDPDRLKYPLKRTNPYKGIDDDPGFVRITWDEALNTIAERFGAALKDYGQESLLFVSLPGPDVLVRLMNSIGVVNRIDHIDECFLTDRIIQRYTTGAKTWANDFANSKYILLFGWDILAKTKIVYANGIIDAKDNGAKVVCFNPQYSTTARFADEWYPIRPGSDLAVALAMINVIVSENLYDKAFVGEYTNFTENEDEIRKHFAPFTPEWAEKESDVPAAAIRRIAQEFGTAGPSIVPAHKKTLCANYQNASQLVHAISILNILAGTLDRPGGRYLPATVSVPGIDAIVPPPAAPARAGRRVDGKDKLPLVLQDGGGLFSTAADGMLNRYPGMIKAAFVNAYTALGFPQPQQMLDALATVPFLAVMDFLPTDTVTYADIVLPSTTYFEVNDIVVRDYLARQPQVIARQAVVPALFETRSAGFVALELGKRMAPNSFKNPDGSWINLNTVLDEKVKRANLGASFAEFRQKGIVTIDRPYTPRTRFGTPSGKCQIYVPQFKEAGGDALPVWRPKRELPSAEYPYYYLTFIPAVHRRNTTENNKILNEMLGTTVAQMNPELARKLGIQEGQTIRIRSRVGAIELPAHLTATLRADSVLVPHGFGHRSRLLGTAGGKGVRDGDVIPSQSIQEMVDSVNYAGAACIMDAVVAIDPL
ncbi:MAG: molybdopterin-dependent oxidoreductase [Bryobacteraceae bacterium]